MNLLEGKTAVVTGAAQGIGRAIAMTFAANGARVVVVDRDGETATATAESLGDRAQAVVCDVSHPEQVDRLAATVLKDFGSADVLVNNAGIVRDAAMHRMPIEDFRAVLDVHLTGAWLVTRALLSAMRETGGTVINMSSIAAKVGNPGQTNYSAAKAGLVGLTKASAKELARHRIRVNAIQPGLIRTSMTDGLAEDVWNAKLAEIPLGRAGEPAEVADVALFLASDLSRYMTGCVLEVSGGRHM